MAPLSTLVYESQAVAPLSDTDLHQLIDSSQTRNQAEGVTGLLVYFEGRFLQWLEGPGDGLRRVWQSIRQDARHTRIALLGESPTPVRLFGDRALLLGKRCAGDDAPRPDVIELPTELIETLRHSTESAPALLAGLAAHPTVLERTVARRAGALAEAGQMSLAELVRGVIVPKLAEKHALSRLVPLVIDPRAPELARLLLAAEPRSAFALIDSLRADGRSMTQLCAGLFEPAARLLGDLWQADDCSDMDVTLGLGNLQIALCRISLETPSSQVLSFPPAAPHAVLVAPSPHETHMLGSAMACEMFWRAGWDVSCEFPATDAALGHLLHDRWFDVLDLSLSGTFAREHRLPEMAASIRAAHAQSLNPALTVIVDGRVFIDQPGAFAEVGADASSDSAMELVSTALRQVKPRH